MRSVRSTTVAAIRALTTIEECQQVAALEREIWAFTDDDEIIGPPVLIASIKRGGILLGVFADDGPLTGFIFSSPAVKDGQLTQWSHMLGVAQRARDGGLGARLKRAQREAALQMGVELIEWTFDPLQALNAHFNFAKLGVVVEEYDENAYGLTTSPLHAGTPTDRFVAAWYLKRPHVERRISSWGRAAVRDQSVTTAVLVNQSTAGSKWRAPGAADLSVDARRVLVEIPTGFGEMLIEDRSLAMDWRMHTREVLQHYLSRGYRVVDFFLARDAGRGHYLLASSDDRCGNA